MGAIKREPVPPGPITELFIRLDDLHSRAGRPSMREIATRVGRGNISSSTVHNIFRNSRVPRWSFLEQVIKALDGDQVRDEFLALWEAAWRAEQERETPSNPMLDVTSSSARAGRELPVPLAWQIQDEPPRGIGGETDAGYRPSQRIWSNEIPPRNVDFTGRSVELNKMAENLDNRQPPRMQVISGMGGIGKTEIAAEYVHRNINKYEIIWWIRAEHHDRVRDALVKLGQRLDLRQASADGGRDRTILAVLAALRTEAHSSWLLVYDNAINPLDLQKYMPDSRPGGHIIITSRQLNWPNYIIADGIEISPFSEQDAINFLRHKVPGLASNGIRRQLSDEENTRREEEAGRLAAMLGHLPIAIDHAAAYLAETNQSVDEYLTRFAKNAHQLFSEQSADLDLPKPVSGTWAMSTKLLTPDAEHLFNLCAFFSPEPIASELFLKDIPEIDHPPGLSEFLSSSQRFRAAATQLHRLSLAKVDGARDQIQMHRVVQAVTQGRLRQDRGDMFHAYRTVVDMLLANSNPGNPDRSSSDVAYDLSLQHIESDYRFLHTRNGALRELIIDQVRRLHSRGGHVEAMQFGQDALKIWRKRLGEDDLHTLTMAVEVAIAMYMGGRAADAHELILQIRPLLQRYTDGDGFKAFLLCENIYGADLRRRSQFREALNLDSGILPKFEIAFGRDHDRTLNVRNNIAVDFRQLGRFKDALEIDQRTLDDRLRILGPTDLVTLHSYDAVARDLRGLGLYQNSLDIARQAVNAFDAAGVRENLYWLNAREGFAAALRKAGHHWDALQESEHVLQRWRDYLGADHMYTLRAAINLVNDRRAVSDLVRAEELGRETRDLCLGSSPPDDFLYATLVNLASVLRAAGRPGEALLYDEQARRGLIRIYGDLHPFTLSTNINYAADLAACGKLGEAIQIGHETLSKCEQSLGPQHPDTLMAATNLSIDEASAGDRINAEQRLAHVLDGYAQTLTLEHPEARAAARGTRLTAEIEPYDV